MRDWAPEQRLKTQVPSTPDFVKGSAASSGDRPT
jgi:hypothetical protein